MIRGNASAGGLLLVLLAMGAGADDAGKAVRVGGLVLRGRVDDAADGRPIARFRMVPAPDNGPDSRPMWQPHLLRKHEGGRYEFPFPRGWGRTRFRVDAEGYRPVISRVVKEDEGQVTLDFALKRDPGLSGMVRTAEGTPVAGARVMFATTTSEARVSGGRLQVGGLGGGLGAVVVESGIDGTFRLPAEADPGTIVAMHERHGYAEVAPEVLADTGDVTLHPWGRVEGRILAGDAPMPGRLVTLGSTRPFGRSDPTISHSEETTTDAAGRFVFDRVAPGRAFVNRATRTRDGWMSVFGTAAGIEVVERGTTRLTLGGPGRAVIGRLKPRPGETKRIAWSKFSIDLSPPAPHIGLPGDDEFWAEYRRFAQSAEGRPYFRDNQPLGPDGTFRLDGVPQGHYRLRVWARGDPDGGPEAVLAASADVEVPATPDGRGDPIDLGALPIRDGVELPE